MINRLLLGQITALVMILFTSETYGASPAPGMERFYIGTYSGAIYVNSLNLGNRTFGTISQAAVTGDPSFVAMTPDHKYLYAVNEGGGTVVAYSVNPTNGSLAFLNSRSSDGDAPAHIVVDRSGRNVLVANYNGGSVTVFPIQTNGQLAAESAHIQHPGAAPHPHCFAIDASNHFAFVCDKGLDQIRCYVFDPAVGTLTTNTTLITPVAAGSGPRHMVFDPTYTRAYVICETASTIIGFNFDATNGTLTSFQTVSTLLPAGSPGNATAEIAIHSSGKFLYGSNRGYNSVAVFAVNPVDGTLTQVQQQATGATPRNFALDPTGAYCIVAGQGSSDVRLYSINQTNGFLTDTGRKFSVSAPVCILPFILNPPQPVVTFRPSPPDAFALTISNTLSMFTYQLYEAPALTPDGWNLVATGVPGQTNFVLSNTWPQDYFRVGVLTNY